MNKRVLFISRFRGDAAGTGGQQRRHATLSALRRVAEVEQLILGDDPDSGAADELYLPSLNRPRFKSSGMLRFIDPALVRVAQGWTDSGVRLSAADRHALAQRLNRSRYDMFFANRAAMAKLVLSALPARQGRAALFTDLDDVVSDLIVADLRTRGLGSGMQNAAARAIEARLVRRIESDVIKASAMSFVCSHDDRARLASRYPAAAIEVLPNVSRAAFLPMTQAGGRLKLLFVGSLDYEPNRDGLAWFLESIWPEARQRFGDRISLTIVGRGTDEQFRPYSGIAGTQYHRDVPSLEPFYRSAGACVVPIRYGGGTSIKTIEAMAAGRPVLSTAVGVRGLGLKDGEQYLGFEDAAGFVGACEALDEKPSLRDALVASARSFWESRFSQGAVDRVIAAAVG